MKAPSKAYLAIFILLALAGLLDSTYLAAEHFMGVIPPCSVVSGCEKVLTSSYSVILGVPVALLGALYYGFVLAILISYLDTKNIRLFRLACLATVAGLAASAYFVAVQAFVLAAWCFYCLISAGTSTLLFIMGMIALRRRPSGDDTHS